MDVSLTATGTVSGLVGGLAYLVLLGFTLANLRSGVTGRALLLCTLLTLIYLIAVTLDPNSLLAHATELLFELGWVLFTVRILRLETPPETPLWQQYPAEIRTLLAMALLLGVAGIGTSVLQDLPALRHTSLPLQLHVSIQILISTLGLVLLEQVSAACKWW